MSITRAKELFWTSEAEWQGYTVRIVRLEARRYAVSTGSLWDIVYLHPPDSQEELAHKTARVAGLEPHPSWWVTSTSRLTEAEKRETVALLENRWPDDFEEVS